ncbi:hypothetical protein Tco_0783761, partial [Tanacetum coccineum]
DGGLDGISRGVIGDNERVISNGEMVWIDVVFDGALGALGEEEVVMGEGVVVTSSSLEILSNNCLGGIMILIVLRDFLYLTLQVPPQPVEDSFRMDPYSTTMLISYLDLTVDDFGLVGVEWFKMRINIRWILKDLRNLIGKGIDITNGGKSTCMRVTETRVTGPSRSTPDKSNDIIQRWKKMFGMGHLGKDHFAIL